MNTITFSIPSIYEVVFTTNVEEETIAVKGNFASGDDEQDKDTERKIIEQVENGNVWAWCSICVTAEWKGLSATEYLGCCSYKSKEDFEADAYYPEMKIAAYCELVKHLKKLGE